MKIAIAGYDVEGRASYRYYSRLDDVEITIFDEAPLDESSLPQNVEVVSGPSALDELKRRGDYDLVLRTPGLPPAKLAGVANLSSATEEFLRHCPAPIIGVTGTKGKGTVCSLIDAILTAAGQKSWLVGNIGKPALDVLDEIGPDDVVVYEMSSFQLWDVDKSPHIAVVTMVEADHLDRHAGMEDYLAAKANIRRYQQPGDHCLYYPDNQLSAQIALTSAGAPSSSAVRFGVPDDGQVYVDGTSFCVQGKAICDVSALQLPGRHNLLNACAAIGAARCVMELPNQAVASCLSSFDGLPHRLKFVAEKAGVRYYDDSIATTPGSAIAAIDSFTAPKVLIVGGYDKGADYEPLTQKVADCDSMRAVVCIGRLGKRLAEQLRIVNPQLDVRLESSQSMAEIVRLAGDCARAGDVVILSPAAASFDMFKSYADRGEQFAAAVSGL